MATSKRISEFDVVSSLSGTEQYILEKEGIAYNSTLDNMIEHKRYGKMLTISASTTINLDLTMYDLFIITATGNLTIGISAFKSPPVSFMLRIKQDGTGGRVITFSSAFKFPNNEMFTLGTNPGDIEWFVGHHIESSVVELLKADGPFNLSV